MSLYFVRRNFMKLYDFILKEYFESQIHTCVSTYLQHWNNRVATMTTLLSLVTTEDCHYDTRRYKVGIMTAFEFRCQQIFLSVSLMWCPFCPIRNFWTNNGSASTATHNTFSRWVSRWWRSWVGATKPISSVPLFSEIFNIVKTHVRYWISRLYLTGDAAAQLRWHMSNINVIQRI